MTDPRLAITGTRNGMPDLIPYARDMTEERRRAQVDAHLLYARARAIALLDGSNESITERLGYDPVRGYYGPNGADNGTISARNGDS